MKKYSKSLDIRKLEQNKKNNVIIKRNKELKLEIISEIKNRSIKKNILTEISKDIEKAKLKPKNLLLIDFINKKISKS
ncbi:MAG: hypothetical protein ACFFB8_01565 [Promethearchaeota archaeon]